MKRLAAALFFVGTFAIALHAQSPTQIIRGRVVADDTGDPLPHARVVIYNDATPLPPIFTDKDGRFASTPMANGRYRLSVTKAGYVLTSIARLDAASADGVDVRMPRSASISGRVFDASGEPSIGTAINISAAPPPGADALLPTIKTVVTDDLGDYRFGGLARGTYVVAVNGMSNISYFPGVLDVDAAQRFVLQPGDEKTAVDFSGVTNNVPGVGVPASVLARLGGVGTSTIRGRVTRADGLPLAHAAVQASTPLDATGRGKYPPLSTTTDENGQYEFAALPAGGYRVYATKPGFTAAVHGQRTGANPLQTIEVAEGQTRTRIDIALPRHSAVAGRIVDDFGDPLEGVAVNIWRVQFSAGRRRLVGVNGAVVPATDDRGQYRAYGLPAGRYIVSASVGQLTGTGAGADVSGFAPTYVPGTTNVREAQRVAVPLSQDVTGVDFALVSTATATISGTRLGADGRPMSGVLTLVESERSGAIVSSTVGARIYDEGRFEFRNVPPGEYVIHTGTGKSSVGVEGDSISQFVTVSGSDVSDLVLQATPGSTISGRVIFDGDGTPPSYRGLAVIPEGSDLDRTPDGGSIARGEVAEDLTFAMSAVRGPRRLILDRNSSGWGLKSVTVNGVDVTDAPIDFGTPAQSVSDVQVILTDRLPEITASVVDARGQSTADYALLVFPRDRERWYLGSRFFRRTAPEPAGTVTVRGLPSGDYYVAPVAASASVLNDGADAWQDPEFLDAIALRAARATLTEGQKLSLSVRLVTP